MITVPTILIAHVLTGRNFSLHRTKRDLTENFREKHVTFVSEGTPITFNFFKQSLPDFANTKERVWHTFIIVFLKKAENEGKQKTSFWTMLNTVMSKKIRSNVCVAKGYRIPYAYAKLSTKIINQEFKNLMSSCLGIVSVKSAWKIWDQKRIWLISILKTKMLPVSIQRKVC